jgi:hypothetical protein
MIRSRYFSALGVLTLVLVAGCSGEDGDKTSSSGGSSSGGSSSGGSSSGGSTSSSGSSSSGGSTSSSGSVSPTEPTKKEMGAQCTESAQCKSDFCIFKSGGSIGMCTQTCADDLDCPGFDYKCVEVSDAPQKVCVPK